MPRPHPATVLVAVGCALTFSAAGAIGLARGAPADADGGWQPSSGDSAPVPSRPPIAAADRSRVATVAPLHRLTSPDVVVDLRQSATAVAVHRIRTRRGVVAVAVLDHGRVRLGGRRMPMVGVDPGEVRSFTPALTARSDALWRSVAGGEMTVSYAAAHGLRHRLGTTVPVHGRGGRAQVLRIGALASVGLGDAGLVVGHAAARGLGLQPATRLLVAAPRMSIGAITATVRRVFGRGAVVHGVRPHLVDQSVMSAYARATVPAGYLALYRGAAATCVGLPWTVLAGIGAVETGHGADTRTSRKGAEGPMQFLPSTFAAFAVDGNGDGVADIQNPADAVYSAARYLCLAGAGRGGQALYDAIWAYNHADWYVREVLAYAVAYSP